jgi:hypothetical protein
MRLPADSSGLVAGGVRQLAPKIDGCQKQNSAYQFARVPVISTSGGCPKRAGSVFHFEAGSQRSEVRQTLKRQTRADCVKKEGKCLLL